MATGVSPVSVVRAQLEMVYAPVITFSTGLQIDTVTLEGLKVRIYTPQTDTSDLQPCVLYFHGGGWTYFSIDSYDTVTRKLSHNSGAIVISVEYSKSPEHPYPKAFEECSRVTRYILHHGEQFNVDTRRIAVAGDGTGGNLAAAVALRLSEEDPNYTPPLKLQILIQPVLQVLTFNTPSYRDNAYYSLIDRSQMVKFWCHYLGIEPTPSTLTALARGRHLNSTTRRILYSLYMAESEVVGQLSSLDKEDIKSQTSKSRNHDLDEPGLDPEDVMAMGDLEAKVQEPFIAPIMSDNLSQVSPALVLVGERDVARDDGLVYAYRLRQAGVNVTLSRLPGTGQGHLAPLLPPFSWPAWLMFSNTVSSWELVYKHVIENL